jgi:PAS domain S-box-containing protein
VNDLSPPSADSALPDPEGDVRLAVRGSPLPVLLLRVSDRCIVEVSDAVASLFGAARNQLLEHDVGEFIDELAGIRSSLQLVASGAIDGYRRFQRSYRRLDGGVLMADVWLSAYSDPPRRYAIAIVLPADRSLLEPPPSDTDAGDPLLAVGTVDGDWRVDRISADVEQMLGYSADQVIGSSILASVHPSDVPALLTTMSHALEGPGGASIRLRLRGPDGSWRMYRAIISPLAGKDPPPFGFAITPINPERGAGGQQLGLDDQLRLIARELAAAGVTSGLTSMPTARELPALARLSSREMEIVTRLLAGDRVPLIARSLFLGESTVRNHLSSVFRKLGVNSQQELLSALRPAA